MDQNAKLPMWKKISYGCGAGGGSIINVFLSSYLTGYYTDTVGIAAAAIGTMFLVSRLLDGFTDFAMGSIVDKTRTRWGKARPWLVLSAPLMMVGLFLLFSVPVGWSHASKLAYAYGTYIFLNCIVYTIYGIAHSALLSRMTRDSKDRNTISVVSSICSSLVGLVVGSLSVLLQTRFGWQMTGLILGILAAVLVLIAGLTIKETVGMDEGTIGNGNAKAIPIRQQLPAVLKNRYFYLALLIGAFHLFVMANANASQQFYCRAVLGEPMFMFQLLSIGQLPGILILLIMPWFANRFSKRSFMCIGCLMMIAGFCILGVAGSNHTLLLLGTILRAAGIGPVIAGQYAFVADACDYGEWKSGIRSEGLVSAALSIGAKIGIGIGSAITVWVLAATGYVGGALVQSESAIAGVKFAYSWMGVILSVFLLICILLMDVEKYLPQIREDLGGAEEKADLV